MAEVTASRTTPGAAQPPADVSTHARTLAKLVRGKNIHETTLLATDYLNHFNEIIMLLELLPDMPEMIEEAKAWRPKSYVEHFRDSSFADKELAIFAYENAPARFRVPFDATVSAIDDLVAQGLARIEKWLTAGNAERLAVAIAETAHNLRRMVDVASAIIHGDHRAMDQKQIDAMLNG